MIIIYIDTLPALARILRRVTPTIVPRTRHPLKWAIWTANNQPNAFTER